MNRIRTTVAAAFLALGAAALAGCVPAAAHERGHGQAYGYGGYGGGHRAPYGYQGGHYIPYGYEHYLYGRPYSYHSPRHYNPGYGYWPRPGHHGKRGVYRDDRRHERADAAPRDERRRKPADQRRRRDRDQAPGPVRREPGREKPAFEALRIYPG